MKYKVIEVSGNDFVERQTKEIAKTWKSSHPKPRGWAMGFIKPKRQRY